jgi:hypothetical protein
MSVDANHRKEVCRLLKERFSGTQFIITTHDKVWLNQMKTAGLVNKRSAVVFGRWTVEQGPYVSEAKEAWDEIAAAITKDDAPEAAGALRRYLEFLGYELADKWAAEVPMRLDGAFELGELFPRVMSRWRELLGKAVLAAESWGDREKTSALQERKRIFSDAFQASNVEQWAINKAVHYNEWASFSAGDFKPVVDTFRVLIEQLQCPSCSLFLYLEPRTQSTSLRCGCADTTLNLVPKERA